MEVNFLQSDRILVISPHQDDETIGCGGLLALYGKQCDVLLLTDGRYGNIKQYKNTKELVEIRNKEFSKVMKMAKVNKFFMLNIENNKLYKHKKIVKNFDLSPYDYIFIPNRYEDQEDHKVVYKIVKSMPKTGKIYEYEVWTPLQRPSWFLDISKVIEKKKKMLLTYKSQQEDKNYCDSTIGLNKYRGIYNNYKYAEAYSYSYYNRFTSSVYSILPQSIKNKIISIINK